ncbi:unnamed protein product [Zymoseptoria tritici ST99CH_1E4]|uniref:tRNA (guanine(9)-N1)-methyltransferase n=1 Tax=Zymoseptoria tritici ST99CH_1E4 TaxID=1276532 RepID=A0A2H1H4E9_ZYMTR|nr:unnamed protein product [Zymoseptoria tritici ST99CH_1E4]
MDSEERPTKMRKLENGDPENSSANAQSQADTTTALSAPAHDGQDISHEEANTAPSKATEISLPTPTTTAPLLSSTPSTSTSDPPLSKSQQKKLKKRLEWESSAASRKAFRKEKQTAKRERLRAQKASLPPAPPKPQPPRAIQLPITILIDCAFDDLMHEGERTSLSSQITRCYSDNKNSGFRAHLAICSFGGRLKERFDEVLKGTYLSWKGVRTFPEGFVEVAEKAKEWMGAEGGGKLKGVFDRPEDPTDEEIEKLKAAGEVVYLTSEATSDLTELKPYSTYIIGGLVDKNRAKGICFKRATQAGIKTARLPIGEFMEMQSRKVLATNHVNEIMVKWLECGDWAAAFMKAIPKRKGGKLKGEGGEEDDAGEGGKNGGEDEKEGSKNGGADESGGDDEDGGVAQPVDEENTGEQQPTSGADASDSPVKNEVVKDSELDVEPVKTEPVAVESAEQDQAAPTHA